VFLEKDPSPEVFELRSFSLLDVSITKHSKYKVRARDLHNDFTLNS